MNALKYISLLIFVLHFFACNQTDKRIIRYVKSACTNDNDTCRIDLRQVLNVDYDCMYLFGEYTQPDEISSVMGIAYSSNKSIADSHKRIILVKNNQIVYEGDFSTRHMTFVQFTERVDTIHKNTYYLVHCSPYYYSVRKYLEYSDNYCYFLTVISNNKKYYRRTDYNSDKGYTFEKVIK
jgi:hypothetical protein